MSIQTLTGIPVDLKVFPGSELKANEFALLLERVGSLSSGSGIIVGCNPSRVNASVLGIAAGFVMVRGRLVYIEGGQASVSPEGITTDTKLWITVQVDLTNRQNPVSLLLIPNGEWVTDNGNNATDTGVFKKDIGYIDVTVSPSFDIGTPVYNGTQTRRIYSGTSAPGSTLGLNGDVYFQYSNS